MVRRRRYFTAEDFAAFAEQYAQSEDPAIIRARKRVAEEKFRPLHEGFGGDEGLGEFMSQHDLYPHWRREHLTNVYWPAPQANSGGGVDYLRMGYGKEERLVRELARRAEVFTELTRAGTYDQMGFHYVTQLQIGLNERDWWVNLYIDDKAWLEQRNLVQKLASRAHRRRWLTYLEELMEADYALCFYPAAEPGECRESDSPAAFTADLERFNQEGEAASVSVERFLLPDAPENHPDTILEFVRTEFERLLPLYQFTAWHPEANNHLGL